MFRVIALIVALAAGGLAAWLVVSMQSGEAPPPQAAPVKKPAIEALVAAADLPQGHIVGAKDLRWQVWPKEALSPGLILRSEKPEAMNTMTGSAVRGRLVAGEPILEDKLSRNRAGMLASMLPPGKRAVAIKITAESTAGGFILPNDRVDVIQNVARQEGSRSEHRSRALLSNIRVLAVDQLADDSKGLAVVGKTATLELDPAQVQTIMAAQAAGTLSLALRSSADANEGSLVVPEGGMVRILRAGQSEIVRVE